MEPAVTAHETHLDVVLPDRWQDGQGFRAAQPTPRARLHRDLGVDERTQGQNRSVLAE